MPHPNASERSCRHSLEDEKNIVKARRLKFI